MADSGATMIVHQTRVSQPDGCALLPPTGISSYPEERPLRVYGTATLIAGETALHQECAFHLVGHLSSQTQPSPPPTSISREGGVPAGPPSPTCVKDTLWETEPPYE